MREIWVDFKTHFKKKKWPILTMEYYSGIKENELLINETTWINLKCIMSREKSCTFYNFMYVIF